LFQTPPTKTAHQAHSSRPLPLQDSTPSPLQPPSTPPTKTAHQAHSSRPLPLQDSTPSPFQPPSTAPTQDAKPQSPFVSVHSSFYSFFYFMSNLFACPSFRLCKAAAAAAAGGVKLREGRRHGSVGWYGECGVGVVWGVWGAMVCGVLLFHGF
ncbi:hypothetical protein CLOM_g11403, partial [Closterium sp. NIES-68]